MNQLTLRGLCIGIAVIGSACLVTGCLDGNIEGAACPCVTGFTCCSGRCIHEDAICTTPDGGGDGGGGPRAMCPSRPSANWPAPTAAASHTILDRIVLAVDAQDRPHLIRVDPPDPPESQPGRLRHHFWDGTKWQTKAVLSSGETPASLAVAATGDNIHLLFKDDQSLTAGGAGELAYTSYSSETSAWSAATTVEVGAPAEPLVGGDFSLMPNGDEVVALVGREVDDGGGGFDAVLTYLQFVSDGGTGVVVSACDSPAASIPNPPEGGKTAEQNEINEFFRPTLGRSPNGSWFVASFVFTRGDSGIRRVVRRAESVAALCDVAVDEQELRGNDIPGEEDEVIIAPAPLAIDNRGRVQLSYRDDRANQPANEIKYVNWLPAGQWNQEGDVDLEASTVDITTHVPDAETLSLALVSGDPVVTVYLSDGQGSTAVVVSQMKNDRWQPRILLSGSDNAVRSVIDSQGRLHVAYVDQNNADGEPRIEYACFDSVLD